jgi:hypothetical protein
MSKNEDGIVISSMHIVMATSFLKVSISTMYTTLAHVHLKMRLKHMITIIVCWSINPWRCFQFGLTIEPIKELGAHQVWTNYFLNCILIFFPR